MPAPLTECLVWPPCMGLGVAAMHGTPLRTTPIVTGTIHDLRHTNASLARKSGADLRYVQKTMGHSSPTATANICLSTPTSWTKWRPTAISFDESNRHPSARPVPMQVKNGGQGRDRTGDLPLFRRTLVPTELPGRKARVPRRVRATLTGLEPATSAVTGRRANQLRHRALLFAPRHRDASTPYGIRTRATALKGRRPRPLDEGGQNRISPGHSQRNHVGSFASLGHGGPNPQTHPNRGGSILFRHGPYSSVGRATDF